MFTSPYLLALATDHLSQLSRGASTLCCYFGWQILVLPFAICNLKSTVEQRRKLNF
jgi:hypothetical protein